MEKSQYERKTYIDIAKGIGIILVVVGHCPQVYNPLKQWIYAFHMPLFFFISGLVWNKESHEQRGFFNGRFLLDKIMRLIVPCFIWGAIYMVINAILHRSFSFKQVVALFYGSQAGFSRADSLTSLWFLPCLFIAVCLFEILQKWFLSKKGYYFPGGISIICVAASYFLPRIGIGFPWSFDVALFALALVIWGYLGKPLIEKIKTNIWIDLVICMVCGALLTFTYRYNLQFIVINNVDMAGRHFGNLGLYLIDSISGIVMVLLFSCIIGKVHIISKGFSYLGKCTIPIFIIHKPIVQWLGSVLSNAKFPKVVIVLLSTGIAIGISLLVYQIVKRLLPFAFGEKRKQKQ